MVTGPLYPGFVTVTKSYIGRDIECDKTSVKTVDKESDTTSDETSEDSRNITQDEVSDIDKSYAIEVINEYMSLYMYELSKKSLLPRQLRARYIDNHKRITVYFRNDNVKMIDSLKRATGLDQSSIVNMPPLLLYFDIFSTVKYPKWGWKLLFQLREKIHYNINS